MGRTIDLTAAAVGAASKAAADAGVEIRDVETWDEIRSVSKLFDVVWGSREDDPLLAAGVLRAMTHAGNYAAGAFSGDAMIGAIVGFLGRDADGVYLHSHILGVTDEFRGANVGFALKQHQRAWVLERGMHKVTWTFDPLVRRNAFFNVHKLGATADTYLERFYGSMSDAINKGDETDRLLIVWRLDDARVDAAANAQRIEPDPDVLGRATVALDHEGVAHGDGWGDTLLCATPDDIVALRRDDPPRAAQWRRALRETLGGALAGGYSVTGFMRSGWYVLERSR